MEENNVTVEETKNKKSVLPIIIVAVVVLVALGVGLFFLLGNKSDDTSKDNKAETKTEEKSNFEELSGIYTNGDASIKIYAFKKSADYGKYSTNTLEYSIGDEEYSRAGYFEIKNKKGESDIFDSVLSVEIRDDGLYFTGNDDFKEDMPNFPDGLYKKTAEYSPEDYFKDNYGDPSYLTTQYNGIYKLGKIEMFMYQTDKNEISVKINGSSEETIVFYGRDFEIKEDGTIVEKLIFEDDEIDSTIKLTEKGFEFTSKEYPELNGTYVKEKDITIKDVISRL